MRTATSQFSEPSGSLNRPNLFTELPFRWKSLPSPSFTELPPPFSLKTLFSLKSASPHPLPKNRLAFRSSKKSKDFFTATISRGGHANGCEHCSIFIATPPTPHREIPGPESPRSLRGLLATGSKKCPKQSRNRLRSLKTVYFETPETVSRTF